MAVYIVGALQALLYLGSVPVCAAFWLRAEDGLRFGVGLSAFERRFALRRARRNGLKGLRSGKTRRRGGGRRTLRLLRRLRGASLRLEGRLGLGDAAATALACGALRAAPAALAGWFDRVEVSISPDFRGDAARAELRGMLRVSSGQIILAAAKSGIDIAKRRIAPWTSTRSKAS